MAKRSTKTASKRTTSRSKNAAAVGAKYGFRSGLESAISEALTKQGVDYKYEAETFKYLKPAKVSRYTPDFIITTRPDGTPKDRPLIIESKGRFVTADRQKHILFKDQHPEVDLRFVFSNPNQRISKQSKTTYAMWCEKHGFQFSKLSIPEDWLWE